MQLFITVVIYRNAKDISARELIPNLGEDVGGAYSRVALIKFISKLWTDINYTSSAR